VGGWRAMRAVPGGGIFAVEADGGEYSWRALSGIAASARVAGLRPSAAWRGRRGGVLLCQGER